MMLSSLQPSCRFLRLRKPLGRSLSSFSWAGPRSLNEIIKKELLEGKSRDEISDIWFQYHESKQNVHGIVLSGKEGNNILSRAKESPFFVVPVFRGNGFFTMISQYQADNHFLMAYLEDYKMDPNRASPLLTCSVFVDYANELDLTLCRSDVINRSISDDEGLKIVTNLLDSYRKDEEFDLVHSFNHKSATFDMGDYISRQNARWKNLDDITL